MSKHHLNELSIRRSRASTGYGLGVLTLCAVLSVFSMSARADDDGGSCPNDKEAPAAGEPTCKIKVHLLQAERNTHASDISSSDIAQGVKSISDRPNPERASHNPVALKTAFASAQKPVPVAPGTVANDSSDESLDDLKQRLSKMPLSEFRMLGAAGRRVELGEPAEFKLIGVNGVVHQVVVTPRETANTKVKFALEWVGPTGETLVHSQMGVANGNLIVVGADGAIAGDDEDHSAVLSVRINCRQ